MTDFVIVVAALASIAAAPGASAVPPVPQNTPTVGFHTYPSVAACEEAAAQLAARPGTRLVCLPVETNDGEMASAY